MKVIIGADFVPTKSNEKLFVEGKKEELLGIELLKVLDSADFRIFNLELPIADEDTPILKCGPTLKAGKRTMNLYKKLNVNMFTLANNHIMDHGSSGYNSTVNALNNVGIEYVGSGNSRKEASKPKVVNIDGKRLGIYACTEHEFSSASVNSPGANPFDCFDTMESVRNLRTQVDYLIVLYHGGKEHYRYPSPDLQKRCRKLVENGANLVVCQHSHCIGCEERYQDGTIVYGQGNFLFDYNDSEFWKTGLIIEIVNGEVKYIPIVKAGNKVRLATDKLKDDILKGFYNRSEEIKQRLFIEKKYKEFAAQLLDGYLWHFSGASRSILLRGINKLTNYQFYKWFVKRKYTKQQLANFLNYFECENISEVLITGLKGRL